MSTPAHVDQALDALAAILQCVNRCRAAPDARTAAQIERRCRERLGPGTADRMAAAAARRIGEGLR